MPWTWGALEAGVLQPGGESRGKRRGRVGPAPRPECGRMRGGPGDRPGGTGPGGPASRPIALRRADVDSPLGP